MKNAGDGLIRVRYYRTMVGFLYFIFFFIFFIFFLRRIGLGTGRAHGRPSAFDKG